MPATVTSVEQVVDRLEKPGPLDPVVKAVQKVVNTALKPQALRDALHGVWLGHPLHPVLTDVPIGMWSAAAVLDLVPGTGPASTTLLATGCAAAVPTVVTGWADWSQLNTPHQRVGVVHAVANGIALGLYAASVGARVKGHTIRGKALSYAGLSAMAVGGYLGGHLAFRQAAGANHISDTADIFPSGWQSAGRFEDYDDGVPTKKSVAGVDLLVVRRGQHVDVLRNKCSHLSGPLSDGEFSVVEGQGCIVCPWHSSTFRLSDGAVVHGPATAPQQRFETRISSGELEVRLPE
jgi:nitrite reductase/ring-hydroxylating ferredoxin subunit/uncharacterized membrane protein